MSTLGWRNRCILVALGAASTLWLASAAPVALAQACLGSPVASPLAAAPLAPTSPSLPTTPPGDHPLPINLPTALKLANVRPIDVAVASQRIELALGQLAQARVLWLPTVYLGGDYFRHDGQLQDVVGNVFGTSKSGMMLGVGPSAIFALSDAIFAPLAARQDVRARKAALQTAQNDSLLAVAEAYFNVQQARGTLSGAEDVARRTEALVRRTEALFHHAELVPELEVVRTRVQAARTLQDVQSARERWRVFSADLTRILRLEPGATIEPLEPPQLRVTLVGLDQSVDDLIAVGLTNRPELATQQALVQATLERLRLEKLRPLVPSILVRGFSTPVTGTLSAGLFGGGINDHLSNFSARQDWDIQVLWELRNLGFANRALVQQRRAENQVAVLELFRTQDRIAAEVQQAHAQAQSAANRLSLAELELRGALDSADKNVNGLGQTRDVGKNVNVLVLIVRPQEAVAALQALGQAYADYYAAVADYDRAQFRLYHALGHPAQALPIEGAGCPPPAPESALVPPPPRPVP
jgi:outer membrane protein TolC